MSARLASGVVVAKIDRVLVVVVVLYSGHGADISLHTRKSLVNHVLLNVI